MLALAATVHLGTGLRLIALPGFGRTLLHALSGGLLLYTHPFGAFSWLSLEAGLAISVALVSWPTLLWLGAAMLGGLLLFAPWLPIALHTASKGRGFWIPPPSPGYVSFAVRSAIGGWPWVGLLVTVLLNRPRRALIPFVALMIGPLALTLGLYATTGTSLVLDRYLICSVPAVVMLIAMGLGRLSGWRLFPAAVAVAAAIALFGTSTYWKRHGDFWHDVARSLQLEMTSDDCLIVAPAQQALPLMHYLRHKPACYFAGAEAVGDLGPAKRVFLATKMSKASLAKLVVSLPDGPWHAKTVKYGTVELSLLSR